MRQAFAFLFIFVFLSAGTALDTNWTELEIQEGESVWASSAFRETLKGKEIIYGPENLFDGNPATPWVEADEGAGIGESVLILTGKIAKSIEIFNGFASRERLFLRNNRIRGVKVSFVAGLTAPGLVTELDYHLYFVKEKEVSETVYLKDSRQNQTISLGQWESVQDEFYQDVILQFSRDYPDFYSMILQDLGIPPEEGDGWMYSKLIMDFYGFFGIRLTIDSVYPGSHYNDTCLAELKFQLEEF